MTDNGERDGYESESPPPPAERVSVIVPPAAMVIAMHDALVGPDHEDTLVACPACQECLVCRGSHLVSPIVSAEYRRVYGDSNPPADPAR